MRGHAIIREISKLAVSYLLLDVDMGTTFYQQSDDFMVTILRCHDQCRGTVLEMDKEYLSHN